MPAEPKQTDTQLYKCRNHNYKIRIRTLHRYAYVSMLVGKKIILLKKVEYLFLQPFAEVAQLVRAQDS